MAQNNTQLVTIRASRESGVSAQFEVEIGYGPYDNMRLEPGRQLYKKRPLIPENYYGRIVEVGEITDDGVQYVKLEHLELETDALYSDEVNRLSNLGFQQI